MKTNYTTSKLFRIVLIAIFALFSTSTMFAQTVETTVFLDNFNRTDLTPGGSPEVTYSVTKTGTASPIIENNIIKLPNVNGESARTWVMAGTSAYSAPFNEKLELIDADSLVWTFNIRQNYNGRLTGIDDASSRGVAVVLVASSSDLSTANGYALINGGASPINYRIVKFSNGLTTASNITVLREGQTLSDNRVYMSIKIVFIPSTKTWKLYDRIDGAASGGSFANPTDETSPYTLAGTIVDATHTNVTMSAFGFAHKYSGTTAFNFWIDNYSAKTFKTNLGTELKQFNAEIPFTLIPLSNGFSVCAENAHMSLYNTVGKKIIERNVNGTSNFTDLSKGIYFIQARTKQGVSVKKYIVN